MLSAIHFLSVGLLFPGLICLYCYNWWAVYINKKRYRYLLISAIILIFCSFVLIVIYNYMVYLNSDFAGDFSGYLISNFMNT